MSNNNRGATDPSLGYTIPELRQMGVKAMRKVGLSIRQIQKLMGYKSPRSIQLLLEKDATPNSRSTKDE